MVNYRRKIGLSAIANSLSTVFALIGSIVTVPLFVRAVGADYYGLFVVLSSVVGFLSATDFGVTKAIANKISYFVAENKEREISRLFSGGIWLLGGIISLFWIILVALFALDIVSVTLIFGIEGEISYLARDVFFILLFFGSIHILFGGIIGSLYRGLNQIPRYSILQSIYTIIYTISFVLFLLQTPSLISIAFFQGIFITLRMFLFFVAAKKLFPWLFFVWSPTSIKAVFPLLKHSVTFFVLSFTSSLIGKTDMLVLSHIVGVGSATVYSISDKILRLPTSMIKVADVAEPSIAAMYQKNETKELSALYAKLVRMNVILKATPLLFILIFSKEIIHLWIGQEFFHSYTLIGLFFFSYMIYAWVGPHIIFINAMFKHKSIVVPMILNVVINLVVSIVLAKEIGLIGIVIGTIAGNLFTNALYLPVFLSRQIKIKPFTEITKVVLSFVPAALILMVAQDMLVRMVPFGYIYILWIGVIGFLYLIWLYFTVFQKSERSYFLEKIHQVRRVLGIRH